MEAGVEIFGAMGDLPTIITMGERFGCKPFEIREWRAEDVYAILYFDYERSSYQERLQQLQKIFDTTKDE